MPTLTPSLPPVAGSRPPAAPGPPHRPLAPAAALVGYVALGVVFGIAIFKSEAISWFRIQEMLRFQGLHLFLVMGSAVITAAVGIRILRRRAFRALTGAPVFLPPKQWGSGTRYLAGGTLFGLGWALTGSCPGPFYALLGAGVFPVLVPLFSALVGTWLYGRLRPHLPH
jgi:uncharacterized protein